MPGQVERLAGMDANQMVKLVNDILFGIGQANPADFLPFLDALEFFTHRHLRSLDQKWRTLVKAFVEERRRQVESGTGVVSGTCLVDLWFQQKENSPCQITEYETIHQRLCVGHICC